MKTRQTKLSGTIFVIIIIASFFLTSLPLANADHAVDYPSFPLDFPSDINNDGKVNFADIVKFVDIYIYGQTGHIDPRGDIVSNGAINFNDIVKFVDGYINYNSENPQGYDTSDHPIAYSDYFRLDVPSRSSATVWDYIIVRFYVPSSLANTNFYLTAANLYGGALRKVQVDTTIKDSNVHSESYPAISLGTLSVGYHLLLFEFREPPNGNGWLGLGIGSQSGTAQLDRFRIQIPDYTDSAMYYKITTNTTFTTGSPFFLKGNGRSISDIWYDQALLWPNWMWTTSTDTYYNVGDGFLYPINVPTEHLDSLGRRPFSFYFSTVNSGFIDFQFVAQDYQSGLIGAPKLYAMNGQTSLKPYVTMNSAQSISCGSTWDNPGISMRNATAQATYDFHYQESNLGFNTEIALSIGNWWTVPYSSSFDSPLDIGIPLNLTVLNPPSVATGWRIDLTNYKIALSSIDQIGIGDIETSGGHSGNLMQGGAMATSITGTALLGFVALATSGFSTPIIIANGVGTTLSVVSAIFSYQTGQPVSDYTRTTQNGQCQLIAQNALSIYLDDKNSASNLVFMHLVPTGDKVNGIVKVVLTGTLVASNPTLYGSNPPSFGYFPLADIEVTIAMPWFIF